MIIYCEVEVKELHKQGKDYQWPMPPQCPECVLPLVLCGFTSLIEKLRYHTSRAIASRVIGRSHLEGLNMKDMDGYLNHHLMIAGVKEQLFSEEAVLSITQNSGGLLRRANALAKGSLMAADLEQCPLVSAAHVRIASTELI